ncbi:hypothetical protein [Rugamonas aquatica]|uniref:Uncharacterized protein n=1 Tax=Rugamonas aquatica TaxID=2743357 RepID=A0A6A7N792_9BURK|nr:hypothetical protein [Rugamonas aquatica]MQA40732.1 hypothetical protein [Rugamonas aquatica]
MQTANNSVSLVGGGGGVVDPLSAGEVRFLVGLAFAAALRGQCELALQLFDALGRLRPNASFALLGQAVALLAVGHFGEAVAALEQAQLAWPDDEAVQAVLGLALQRACRHAQAQRVLSPLAAAARDGAVRYAARDLLETTGSSRVVNGGM